MLSIWRGFTVAAFALLGGVAFTTPQAQETTIQVPCAQAGSFSYRSAVPSGPVYGAGGIETGDPVYLRLASDLDVRFGYTFRSDLPHRSSGTARLFVTISDVNGWTRRSALGPGTAFTGDETTVNGRLDLAMIHRLLTRVERLTGVARDQYEVRVLADVRLAVSADAGIETLAFDPELVFQIDPFALRLSADAAAVDGEGGMLHPRSEGTVDTFGARPATISILGQHIDVRAARVAGVAGAMASAGMLVLARITARRRRREDATNLISRRYGRMLVPVRGPMDPASHQVEVADIETLVRLAEHHDGVILQSRTEGRDDFAVEHDGIRYHYAVGQASAACTAASSGHRAMSSKRPGGSRRPAALP